MHLSVSTVSSTECEVQEPEGLELLCNIQNGYYALCSGARCSAAFCTACTQASAEGIACHEVASLHAVGVYMMYVCMYLFA